MAAVGMALLASAPAAATHFRYGHMWANKNQVRFDEVPHTPDLVTGLGPQFKNVGGSVDGVPVVYEKVTFLESGGISVIGPSGLSYTADGPRLFSGTAAHPEFKALKGLLFNPATGQAAGRFFMVGVPEPTSWALMIAGFGAVGVAARRQRRLAL